MSGDFIWPRIGSISRNFLEFPAAYSKRWEIITSGELENVSDLVRIDDPEKQQQQQQQQQKKRSDTLR